MKVLYYERYAGSPFHVHAGSSAKVFYIPERDIIIYSETHGSFGSEKISYTKKGEILKEAKAVMDNNLSIFEGGPGISNIKEINIGVSIVDSLITNTITEKIYKDETEKYFEYMMEKCDEEKGETK
jgi:hypothetical protein